MSCVLRPGVLLVQGVSLRQHLSGKLEIVFIGTIVSIMPASAAAGGYGNNIARVFLAPRLITNPQVMGEEGC